MAVRVRPRLAARAVTLALLIVLSAAVPSAASATPTPTPTPSPPVAGALSQAADDLGVQDTAVTGAVAALTHDDQELKDATSRSRRARKHADALGARLPALRRGFSAALGSELVAAQADRAAAARLQDARHRSRSALWASFEQSQLVPLQAWSPDGSLGDLSDRTTLLNSVTGARTRRLMALGHARTEAANMQQALADVTASAHAAEITLTSQTAQALDAAASAEQAQADVSRARSARARTLLMLRATAAQAHRRYQRLQDASARYSAFLAQRAALALARPPATPTQPTGPAFTGFGAWASPQGTIAPAAPSPGGGGLVMPTVGTLSSPFGYRDDPFGFGRRFHAGQDISAPQGTPIVAAAAGTVALVQTPDQSGGYGNYTCIDHGSGVSTCYAHQFAVYVQVGDVVSQGQLIGLVGTTGASTGPHLHFEVRINGQPVDPLPYLP